MALFTEVEFQLKCETKLGEFVGIVGDAVRLGCWKPEEAVKMKTSEKKFPLWSVKVVLPVDNRVQYKYVIMKKGGEVDWEERAYNRVIFVQASKMIVRDGEYGETINSDDEEMDHRITVEEFVAPMSKAEASGAKLPQAVSPDIPLNPSSTLHVVSYRLPIITTEDSRGNLHFTWDNEALYRTSRGLMESLKGKVRVMWIGLLRFYQCYDESKQEEINRRLLDEFNCVPVWPRQEDDRQGHYRFCKEVLWDLFHNVINPLDPETTTQGYERTGQMWQGYMNVNHAFAHRIEEVYHDEDMVWIQDYHLCLTPSYLRRRVPNCKIGFFLHTPFPSSQAYRALPQRDELIHGILSSSLVGFHLFDYARHFLSACTRLLGLEYQSQKGSLGVEYHGRYVTCRVSHIGIWPAHLKEAFDSPDTLLEHENIQKLVGAAGTVACGIDDFEVMKGIPLKLLAWERFLSEYAWWRGKIVLFQIVMPRSTTTGTKEKQDKLREDIQHLVQRINEKFGTDDYVPVRLYERNITIAERTALLQRADLLLTTPLREGLNMVPYEFIACSSGPLSRDRIGAIVLSEFTGCSFALSGPVRVNPWNIDEVVRSIDDSLSMPEAERKARRDKDYEYVMQHTTSTWALSFINDLWKVKERGQKLTKLGLGFGLGFRMMDYGTGFRKLDTSEMEKAYRRANNRLIVLDYEGTLTGMSSNISARFPHRARPPKETLDLLNQLASDLRNRVFVFSGRMREVLDDWFGGAPKVGLAAEQGFYYHLGGDCEDWQKLNPTCDLSWKEVAYDIMQTFVERTDGSYIDQRTSSIVWHFDETDYEFGKWQAKELGIHLESVLRDVGVVVTIGKSTVVVKPKGINKGIMMGKILRLKEQERGDVDFVLAVGDDRSDEDMFAFLKAKYPKGSGRVFSTTVGQKPSNASFYLDSYEECLGALRSLHGGNSSRLGSRSVADFRTFAQYDHDSD